MIGAAGAYECSTSRHHVLTVASRHACWLTTALFADRLLHLFGSCCWSASNCINIQDRFPQGRKDSTCGVLQQQPQPCCMQELT